MRYRAGWRELTILEAGNGLTEGIRQLIQAEQEVMRMEAEMTEVEFYARFVQDEWDSGELTEIQSRAKRIWEAHRNGGPGRYCVKPWLAMSKSSTCTYHCDGFECDGFERNKL